MPQNTIIVQRVSYKGYDLVAHKPGYTNSASFFQLKSFGFLEVATKNEIIEKVMGHGYYTGMTRNTTRTIVMTIGIIATNAQERRKMIKLLDSIFQPPTRISSVDDEYFTLSFVDPAGKERTTQAKVLERPKYSDYNSDDRIDARVELLPDGRENGAYRTGGSYTASDTNHWHGMTLPTNLPASFMYTTVSPHTYAGISTAPITATITALQDNAINGNMVIRSRSDYTNTALVIRNLTMLENDVLEVDGIKNQILKNGNDITATSDPQMDTIPLMHVGDNYLVVDT